MSSSACAPGRNDPGLVWLRAFRHGDGRAELMSIETFGPDNKPTIVWKSGDMATVRATVQYNAAVDNPVLGLFDSPLR